MLIASLGLLLVGCAGERAAPTDSAAGSGSGALEVDRLDPPAAPGSLGPNLTVADGRLLMSWIEPIGSDDARKAESHRLVVSRLEGDDWSEPVTVASGADFFANWADYPEVVQAGDGSLLAHWLAKTAEDTYAYSIFLARSTDDGATWNPLGRLNDDNTPTEHGFVSFVPEADGARAFWLDGRAMVDGGPMALRTAHVGSEVGTAEILDDRVCECCSTDAAVTASGPIVVYRDRSGDEIRDIQAIDRSGDAWAEPVAVGADEWRIEGCPVNGPEIAAAGEKAAVAWFTAASDKPTVKLTFTVAGGAGTSPVVIDDERPFGRVDIELDEAGAAWIAWVGKDESDSQRAEVRLQRVNAPDGSETRDADPPDDPPIIVARTGSGRASGFPRLQRIGDQLFIAWVETGDGPQRLRLGAVPL